MKAKPPKHLLEAGMSDERRKRRVVRDGDEAPLRAPLRAVIRADGSQRVARRPYCHVQYRGVEHARHVAEAVGSELAPRCLGAPCRPTRFHRVVHAIKPVQARQWLRGRSAVRRELPFDQGGPVARADGEDLVVEVVARVVEEAAAGA